MSAQRKTGGKGSLKNIKSRFGTVNYVANREYGRVLHHNLEHEKTGEPPITGLDFVRGLQVMLYTLIRRWKALPSIYKILQHFGPIVIGKTTTEFATVIPSDNGDATEQLSLDVRDYLTYEPAQLPPEYIHKSLYVECNGVNSRVNFFGTTIAKALDAKIAVLRLNYSAEDLGLKRTAIACKAVKDAKAFEECVNAVFIGAGLTRGKPKIVKDEPEEEPDSDASSHYSNVSADVRPRTAKKKKKRNLSKTRRTRRGSEASDLTVENLSVHDQSETRSVASDATYRIKGREPRQPTRRRRSKSRDDASVRSYQSMSSRRSVSFGPRRRNSRSRSPRALRRPIIKQDWQRVQYRREPAPQELQRFDSLTMTSKFRDHEEENQRKPPVDYKNDRQQAFGVRKTR